ncbi:hypothetical protein NERG_02358 [Nematocida ausubeli]|uniref:Uncharacterized protein n=1 Tax=Nematocida ausubeli (strain ATCC PRA-371 / ERTm2) TaxID=1913371 RepID=H8ZFI7_NEMA1|nr:hypothetical protein NERG_02358 [Nematocida ausubeli]
MDASLSGVVLTSSTPWVTADSFACQVACLVIGYFARSQTWNFYLLQKVLEFYS